MTKTTKVDLVAGLAEKLGATKKDSANFLNAFEEVVKESIVEVGDKVQLQGFLTLEAKTRSAREGRNPKTGEALHIPEKKYVASKATFKI